MTLNNMATPPAKKAHLKSPELPVSPKRPQTIGPNAPPVLRPI